MDLLKNGLISCCIPENLIEEASGKMDKYIKEIIQKAIKDNDK